MSSLQQDEPAGLRGLKKARTRSRIQDHALRLYRKQGYAGTSIDQIAEAADVSQSTFFRYFPTKAETVLYDRWDPVWMDLIAKQPAELSPLAAVRASIQELRANADPEELLLEQTRWRMVADAPDLMAAAASGLMTTMDMFAETIGARVGREPGDFAVRTWVGALIGVVYAAFFAAHDEPDVDIFDFMEAGLARMEAGLPL